MKPGAAGRSRAGQVIVLAPVILVVLVLILALTTDIGSLLVWRARLQNAADASALAAVHVLWNEQHVEGSDEAIARAAATAEAEFIKQANVDGAWIRIEYGIMDENRYFVPVDTATDATAARVTACRNSDAVDGPVRLAFAPIMGMNTCDVACDAVAEYRADIRGATAGLGPFAVPESGLPPPGGEMIFYPAEYTDDGTLGEYHVTAGTWGILNLDGGELGTPELVDWIENGYNGSIEIDPEEGCIWIDGTTGIRVALKKPMENKEEPMIFLIYDDAIQQGSNTLFRCIGFVLASITEVKLTGQDKFIACQVEEICFLPDLITGGGSSSINLRKIQLIE